MTRILLPTDFSDNSFEAIRYALLAHKELVCTFYLLHTYTPPIYHTEYLIGSLAQFELGDILQTNSNDPIEKIKRNTGVYHINP